MIHAGFESFIDSGSVTHRHRVHKNYEGKSKPDEAASVHASSTKECEKVAFASVLQKQNHSSAEAKLGGKEAIEGKMEKTREYWMKRIDK